MRTSFYDFCVKQGHRALLAQWDEVRNAPLTTGNVSFGSHQKVWWQCSKGHSWQAKVYSRSAGSGCPYCTGRKEVPENSLAVQVPSLEAEWDAEKNAPLKFADLTVGSHKKVWWRCPAGHSYDSVVKSRVQGTGCPVCAGRVVLPDENSLAARYPALVAEWDTEKNAPLLPTLVAPGTVRKAWWRCPKGHSYRAAISSRAGGGTGCPFCAGQKVIQGENDLATQYPQLAAQWDRQKNGALTPEAVTSGSNRRVWWRCEKGHSYPAVIAHRVRSGSDCPYCSNHKVLPGFNDLATIKPVVASQWHPTRNGSLTPQQVTPGSRWLCDKGHAWRAVVNSRTGKQRCGCPICAGRPLDRCTAILSEPPAEPVKISAQTAEPRKIYIVGGPFMKRKLLSVLLTFCLAFSLLPTAALADGEGTPALAEVSAAAGTALPAAVDGVITLENGTYVMSEDTTATIKVPNGKNATLDLNGKTLTNKTGEHTIIVENGATLTITGNGIVDNVSHGKGAIVNSGEVTLNGGTFKRSAEKGTYSPNGNGGNSWYTIANYGTMEINTGVTVENAGGYSSMIRNGGDVTADCNLTIEGGNFAGGINTVKNDSFGVLTINGGNFSNTAQYVIMNWNKAEITAGTFRTLDTASAVLFTSAYGGDANTIGKLSISGGEFKHASDTQEMIVDHYDETNKGNAVVTGGKFDADISKYIPTDYVQSADGTVEKLGETNAVAKVGGTYYKTLADAVAAAQDGDTITLLKDAELTSTLNLAKNITIDGQGKYTIKAANSFTVGSDNKTYCVLYVSGEVTLKDVTVNGNEKCRVIFCDKGKLTIDGATITNGKAPNFIGGVYMTSSASFEMKSGSITGNKNAKGYQNDEYLQYSSDLWIGANANGALTAINGGTIGNVFVNANAWSASNPGSFTMNGGTVTNLYVEHDANYGATFKYNDGTIEHLYLSKENGNGQSIEVTPVKGVIYNGGVKEQDLVTLTMKYNDGATADSTYNVASGTTITLPTPRRSGYTFNGWYDGSKFYAAGASYTVSATVTLNASWSYISSGSSSYDPTYSVSTPSKTENGSVTVSPKNASKGDTVTVTVKPDSGYVLETLTVTDKNGNELTLKDKGDGKYTFTMPAGKVEVKATFMEDNSMLNFFYDVPNNAYFYEAVKWAVKNGITTGVGDNLFAPEQPCTRAQIVTFLWRAAGSPEPKAMSSFADVSTDAYYAKAVAWAVENGITTGTGDGKFSPDATCTRAQSVTFLFRAIGKLVDSKAEFSDVLTDSYYANAVAWAVENGVTNGIGDGLFGPDNSCTRAQIVTFLFRAYQGK